MISPSAASFSSESRTALQAASSSLIRFCCDWIWLGVLMFPAFVLIASVPVIRVYFTSASPVTLCQIAEQAIMIPV